MKLIKKITEKYKCDICGKLDNKILMQVLADGRICNTCFNKLGKDKYKYVGQNSTIQQAKEKLADVLPGEKQLTKIPPVGTIERQEMDFRRDKYIYTKKYKALLDKYYDRLPSIDNLWSVLYNLGDFNGSYAQDYEKLCIENIMCFKDIYHEFCLQYNTVEFSCVPAYKRLAMLYEKQGKYDKATMVCLEAIRYGVPNEYGDGDTGKMYSRLARMAKKAGMLDSPDVKTILISKID